MEYRGYLKHSFWRKLMDLNIVSIMIKLPLKISSKLALIRFSLINLCLTTTIIIPVMET